MYLWSLFYTVVTCYISSLLCKNLVFPNGNFEVEESRNLLNFIGGKIILSIFDYFEDKIMRYQNFYFNIDSNCNIMILDTKTIL